MEIQTTEPSHKTGGVIKYCRGEEALRPTVTSLKSFS